MAKNNTAEKFNEADRLNDRATTPPRATNDNNLDRKIRRPYQFAPAGNNNRPIRLAPKNNPISNLQSGAKLAKNIIASSSLFWMSIGATTVIYFIQIAFAFFCLAGYAILGGLDYSSFLSAADVAALGGTSYVGGGLLWVGGIGAALCGFLTFVVSAILFAKNGLDTMVSFSIIILPVCLTLLLCPVINFLPIMWAWCLFAAYKGIRP